MVSLLLLYTVLFHLLLSTSALPLDAASVRGGSPAAVGDQTRRLAPFIPATISRNLITPDPLSSPLTVFTYRPIRPPHSNTSIQLPHWHSGPWDRLWEVYGKIGERAKLFKRGINPALEDGVKTLPTVRERIIGHLRPTGWWQRLKDWYTRMRYGKEGLKVVDEQYLSVVNKYRGLSSSPYIPPTYTTQKKNGRLGSAFQTRPRPGQASYYRGRASRYGS